MTRPPGGPRRRGLVHWAFMYAKTNPSAGRLAPRQKRVFAVIGVLVVLVIGGLAIWGALRPDTYATSGKGW